MKPLTIVVCFDIADRSCRGFWCKRRKRGIFAGQGATRGRPTAMESVGDLFKGRHFDRKIVILCVLASPI